MALMKNLARLFAAPAQNVAVGALYSACVEQARSTQFYQILGMPDTIDGRFDLLVLHVVLVMRRLVDVNDVKQELFDLMFADMDQSLREMGVGDMGVGKRIKPMISAFYGRMQAYENALAVGDEALSQVLARNLYGKTIPTPDALRSMANYVTRAVAVLDSQPLAGLIEGHATFPPPVVQ